VEEENVRRAVAVFDEFIVDVKDTSPDIYRAYTGKDVYLALNNLKILVDKVGGDRVIVRLPLIPDYNTPDDQKKSEEILRTAQRRAQLREEEILRDAGAEVEEGRWLQDSIRLRRTSNLQKLPGFSQGLWTVQDESSMVAVKAAGLRGSETVFDVCAAPGGKSTMMAEMMENRGSVTACDIHEHRLELIKASAARTGADIIETRLMDGTQYDSSLEGQFDFVLADVPCSGLGVMSTKPEIRLRTDVSTYAELTETQLAILENAYRYTRPGGRICYSTCTLNRDENEGVTGRFMQKLASRDGADAADTNGDFAHDGESGFARIVEMRTVLPYNNLIGFHYCIIEKTV
jgi:16S rRNA (cytosine967-C5)-methyltransferase